MSVDPRTAAEVKFYDIAAHRMHERACNTASIFDYPHSWLYAQWNETFDGWVRTAEYRRLDVEQFGKVQRISYNVDGSVRELFTY